MRNILSKSEIVATLEVDDRTCEVVATAQGRYDEDEARLEVELEGFVREVNFRGPDAEWRPPWMPRRDVVGDHVPRDQASAEAREIFSRWTAKIRAAIPAPAEAVKRAPAQ